MGSWSSVTRDIISWLYRKYWSGKDHCFIYYYYFAVFSMSNKNLKTQYERHQDVWSFRDKTWNKSWILCPGTSLPPHLGSQMDHISPWTADIPNQSKSSSLMSTLIEYVILAPRKIIYIFITTWNPNVSPLKGGQRRIWFLDRGFLRNIFQILKNIFKSH